MCMPGNAWPVLFEPHYIWLTDISLEWHPPRSCVVLSPGWWKSRAQLSFACPVQGQLYRMASVHVFYLFPEAWFPLLATLLLSLTLTPRLRILITCRPVFYPLSTNTVQTSLFLYSGRMLFHFPRALQAQLIVTLALLTPENLSMPVVSKVKTSFEVQQESSRHFAYKISTT